MVGQGVGSEYLPAAGSTGARSAVPSADPGDGLLSGVVAVSRGGEEPGSPHPIGATIPFWADRGGRRPAGPGSDLEKAARRIERLQPDPVLLDISGEAHDSTAALMQLLRDRLDTSIIGVNLQDDCILSTTRASGCSKKRVHCCRSSRRWGAPPAAWAGQRRWMRRRDKTNDNTTLEGTHGENSLKGKEKQP
jgi:hypothetical protein